MSISVTKYLQLCITEEKIHKFVLLLGLFNAKASIIASLF